MAKVIYANFLKAKSIPTPRIHVVLGSGFGEALTGLKPGHFAKIGSLLFSDVEGLVAPSVADHHGSYELYMHKPSQQVVQFQRGRLHGYEGHDSRMAVSPVMIPRSAGIEKFILTNAAGGLFPQMRPGDPMIISDHVNFTGKNPLIGENPKALDGRELGPRFPDVSQLYSRRMAGSLKRGLESQEMKVHEGAYIAVLGPNFETPMEVRIFQSWGLGAVGMSTVWEALALSHSGAEVAAVSLISNLGAGLSAEKLEHHSIVETCRQAASKIVAGVSAAVEEILGNGN